MSQLKRKHMDGAPGPAELLPTATRRRAGGGAAAAAAAGAGEGALPPPRVDCADAVYARAWLRRSLADHAHLAVEAAGSGGGGGGGGMGRGSTHDATLGIAAPELVGVGAQRRALLDALSRTLAGGGGEFVLLTGARCGGGQAAGGGRRHDSAVQREWEDGDPEERAA
jgi:hypothetical protein